MDTAKQPGINKQKRTFVWVLLIALTCLWLGTYYVVLYIQTSYNNRLSDEFERVLTGTQQALYVWNNEHIKRAELLAEDNVVVQETNALIKSGFTDTENLLQTEAVSSLRNFFLPALQNSLYQGFFIINHDTISLASSRNTNIGKINLLAQQPDILARAWAGKAVMSRVQQSDVALSANAEENMNDITMFVISPIKNSRGEVIALLSLRLDAPGIILTDSAAATAG